MHRHPAKPHRLPEGLRLLQPSPTCPNTTPTVHTVPAQFFQEGKYRNFRAPDFLTPQGLDRKKPG